MKKRLSVRTRVTIWYVISLIIIMAVATVIVLFSTIRVFEDNAKESLKNFVDQTVDKVSLYDGKLEISPDIRYRSGNIHVSIFNNDGMCISGLLQDDLPDGIDFDDSNDEDVKERGHFFVYDKRVYNPKTGAIWIRGAVSSDLNDLSPELLAIRTNVLIIFPIMFLIALFGGIIITNRAFKPLKQITDTAKNISEGGDLSLRIGIGDENSKDEILRAAGVFDNMLDKVENAFNDEKRFTNDASHELRTPTAVIMAQSEYALENKDDKEEMISALSVIHSESKKMDKLVSQLLMLARADNGKFTLNKKKIDISLMAEAICEMERQFASAKNISIVTECDMGVYMDVDEVLFSHIYENLISNAIKYGKENGHIWVSVSEKKNHIVITVRDDGKGIEESALNSIFKRFYREKRNSGEEGLGLGLSIVKLIVDAHEGEIQAESEQGKGTVFTIMF